MPRRRRSHPDTHQGRDDAFAARAVDLTQPGEGRYLRTVTTHSKSRSANAWRWYREIGEIHYAISRSAKVAGYARLYACKIGPDGSPGKPITSGFEAELVRKFCSPVGGRRGFVERFFTLGKIAGDAYLIRCRTGDQVTGYDWVSTDEIDQAGLEGFSSTAQAPRDKVFAPGQKIKRITLPSNESMDGVGLSQEIAADDFIGRVWRPSGQFIDMPDSTMRALDTECELLHLLTLNIRSKLLSRFALNGIFFVPNEINDVRATLPVPKDGKVYDMTVLNRLIMAATWAVQNHEQPEAALPIFMTGPGQYADMIKHITYDRQIYEVDMKLRAELIERVVTGLDNQPQAVTGTQDSSHWSAWAATDEERRVNIQPDVETMCWALTVLGLRREMAAANLPPGRINDCMVWYDLSYASAKANLGEDARQLRDRMLISGVATRRLSGVNDIDQPTDEEYVRMVGVKTSDPYLATFGLPIADEIDWSKVGKTKPGPDADSPADEPHAGPGSGDPGSPDDIDSDTPRSQRPA